MYCKCNGKEIENKRRSKKMAEEKKMSTIAVIKKFFEDGGPKVQISELKALSLDERQELANLAAIEMGIEVVKK